MRMKEAKLGSHLDSRAGAAASGWGGGLGVAVWGSFVALQ